MSGNSNEIGNCFYWQSVLVLALLLVCAAIIFVALVSPGTLPSFSTLLVPKILVALLTFDNAAAQAITLFCNAMVDFL